MTNTPLDDLRALVTQVGVCTADPTHEVRCNDEELRQAGEAWLVLEQENAKLLAEKEQLEERRVREVDFLIDVIRALPKCSCRLPK